MRVIRKRRGIDTVLVLYEDDTHATWVDTMNGLIPHSSHYTEDIYETYKPSDEEHEYTESELAEFVLLYEM